VSQLPRLHAMLRFSAACGALTVTQHGAFAAMPTLAEVKTLFDGAHAMGRSA
jgi:fructokinase